MPSEDLSKLINYKNSSSFKEEVEKANHYVVEFCKKYDVELLDIGVTRENGSFEACFTFTDNLGYYTLEGIVNSLKE